MTERDPQRRDAWLFAMLVAFGSCVPVAAGALATHLWR